MTRIESTEADGFPAFAKDVRPGQEIKIQGDWYKVTEASYDIGMRERHLYLEGERRPFMCSPLHPLAVRELS